MPKKQIIDLLLADQFARQGKIIAMSDDGQFAAEG
jgi:hypothetical protein